MYRVRMQHPLWEQRDRYAGGVIRPYNEYVGEVSPAPPYLNDEWFTLTEASGNVRILWKDNVLCSWRVDSDSIGNTQPLSVRIVRDKKSYVVSLSPRGSLICNCTAFSYRKTCSHVKEVMEVDLAS
jgi:hypothetical protein